MLHQSVSALLLAVVFSASLPANAQCPQNNFMQGMNLTAAQQKEIQNIRQKYATDETRQAMQTSRPFQQEMQEIIAAKTFDEDKARDLLTRRAQVQNEMQLHNLRQQNEIYQILTPKQRELWQQRRNRNFPAQGQGRRGGQNGSQASLPACMM